MKKTYFSLFISLFLFSSCGSKEEQKIELLQDATEAFRSADTKKEVEKVIEKYGPKLTEFDDKLTAEEREQLENSIPVSQAQADYSLIADSKCYEFGVY
jgi:predicted ribosome quality control (RQC) complex YloA/Tae2 family protein